MHVYTYVCLKKGKEPQPHCHSPQKSATAVEAGGLVKSAVLAAAVSCHRGHTQRVRARACKCQHAAGASQANSVQYSTHTVPAPNALRSAALVLQSCKPCPPPLQPRSIWMGEA